MPRWRPDFQPPRYGQRPLANLQSMMLYLEGINSLRPSTLGTHCLFIHLTVLPLDVPPHCVQKMVLSHLRRSWDWCKPCHG